MLVELRRVTENEFGEPTGEASLACNPEYIAMFFGSENSSDQSLIALANGLRYKVLATYDEVKSKFDSQTRFIELQRALEPVETQSEGWGEDDGMDAPPPTVVERSAPISFKPELVAMVHGDRIDSTRTIVKLRDGRGLRIRGAYAEVKAALEAQPN